MIFYIYKEIGRAPIKNENWYSYIAYAENVAVGYALFFIRTYDENPFRYKYRGLHVDQICVTTKYQRMNIGTLLMEKIEEFADKKNVEQIQLRYWDKNINAKDFYCRRGFEEMMHFSVKRLP